MIFVSHSKSHGSIFVKKYVSFLTFKRDGRKGLSEGKADVETQLEMKFLQKC